MTNLKITAESNTNQDMTDFKITVAPMVYAIDLSKNSIFKRIKEILKFIFIGKMKFRI